MLSSRLALLSFSIMFAGCAAPPRVKPYQDYSCPVVVKVVMTEVGCSATVDKDSVVVKGKNSCVFTLDADPTQFTFYYEGIQWQPDPLIPGDTQSKAANRANRQFNRIGGVFQQPDGVHDQVPVTRVQLVGLGSGHNDSHYYVPRVATLDGKLTCDAPDPRIAND